MKDIQIIDLIIEDINKFLVKNRISQSKVSLIQKNGVPIYCQGDIDLEDKEKVNEHLKKYKDKYQIFKLIVNHKHGSITKFEETIDKKQIGKRFKNFFKLESELMSLINAKNTIELK